MLTYGIKICNYEAASIYAVNKGVRTHYDFQPAMLTNSLFLDFLYENGLKVYKETSTRDVIGVEFDYGTRSAIEEILHLREAEMRLMVNEEISDDEREKKLARIHELLEEAFEKQEEYDKISADEIRIIFYTEGFDIHYSNETIHYKMLYRSPGKAKKGTCMFICDRLYEKARKWLYMGIELPKENAPIVEIGAYSSLVTSTIVGRIQIKPEEVLVLKDVDSSFYTKAIAIETNENKECYTKSYDEYKVTNTLFDGQALIDLSIFPEWADGYVLLRQHFTKCAAFASDIQLFFKDYFGHDYDSATVTDMWGNEHLAKDIKLITTNNAMKWLKFDVSYEYWSDIVRQNNSIWGIVKTAHESKLGDVQRMSYQMVNSLDEKTIDGVMAKSLQYVELLKTDINAYIDYLKRNANFVNGFDVLAALWEQDHKFEQCDYFRQRRSQIINGYLWNLKNGRLIQNADNLVIVGNPYAMLLHSVTGDVLEDPTFEFEDGTIQCFTDRFDDGEYLAEFRSPFNGRYNLGYLHNVKHEYMHKYFRFGKLIIAVNMINTDFQSRNNGSDMDSDSIYTTNHPDIVAHARYCYENYPTIVNNIPAGKNIYDSSLLSFALVDNNIASRQREIGESSNLAQLALTYSYNFNDKKYEDAVCILSVLAQCAIDSAKRVFEVDITEEIQRIKNNIDVKGNGYPAFWLVIRPGFDRKKINVKLHSPMGYLYKLKTKMPRPTTPTLPISEFFVRYPLEDHRGKCKHVEELIEKYSLELLKYHIGEENGCEEFLLREDFNELINDISSMKISKKYVGLFSWLLDRAFLVSSHVKNSKNMMQSKIDKNKGLLLKVLYQVNSKALLMCFNRNIDIS